MAKQETRVNILFQAKGHRRVKSSIKGIGNASKVSGGFVRSLARNLALLGAGVSMGNAVRVVANFGQEMATVRGVTGATGEEFEKLRVLSKDLGSQTRYSAGQAAEAMKFLGRAGFTAGAIMKSTEGTLRLAQSGALDLGRAADISSNVLTGFNMEAREMGRVVDVMALAANSGNTDIQMLGEAMKFVAPVAAGMGMELEETSAAILALSDAGLQGSLAGTGLRRVLGELAAPGRVLRDTLDELGLTYDQVNPDKVGFTQAMENLAQANLDVGTAIEIFGDRGGPGFAVMEKAIPKIKQLTKNLKNAEGSADKMATIMDDTLTGAFFRVRSALSDFAISIGDLGFTDKAKQALDKIAESILDISRNLGKMKDIMIGMAPIMLTIVGGTMINNWKKLTVGIKLATMAFNLFWLRMGPVGWAVLLFSQLIAIVWLFRDRIGKASIMFRKFGRAIKFTGEYIGTLWNDHLKPWVTGMLFWVKQMLAQFKNNSVILTAMGQAWFLLTGKVRMFIDSFKKVLGIAKIVKPSMEDVLRVTGRFIDSFIAVWNGTFAAVSVSANKFLSYMRFIITDTVNYWLDLGAKIADWAGFESLAKWARGLKTKVEPDAVKSMAGIAQSAAEAFATEWLKRESTVEDIMVNTYKNIKFGNESDAFSWLVEMWTGVPAKIEAVAKSWDELNGLKRWIEEAPERLTAQIKAWSSLYKVVLNLKGMTKEWVALWKGNKEFDKFLLDQKRQLELTKALTDADKKRLELKFLIQDIEADGTAKVGQGRIDQANRVFKEEEALQEDWLFGVKQGWSEYGETINNVAESSKNVFTNALSGMEDAMTTFITTGKLEWRGMIDSLIADLIRLMVQQSIMKAVMGPLGNIFGFKDGGTVEKFATGGIVDKPTAFSFGNNQLGVMGEAGPEGIMPLKRKGNGLSLHTASGNDLLITRLANGIMGIDDTRRTAFAHGGVFGSRGGVTSPSVTPPTSSSSVTFAPKTEVTVNVEGGSNGEGQGIGEDVASKVSTQLDAMMETKMMEFMRTQQRPGNQLHSRFMV